MQPIGFHLRPYLELRSASDRFLARPLRRLGLRAGDVLTLRGVNGLHQQIELSLTDESGGN